MYHEASIAPQPKGLSARDLAFALAVVLPLAAVIAPYRHVHLPQVFILCLAAVGGIWCLKAAVEDVEKLLFAFLLYVPFQKILPGDFGGMVKAFNFTNAFLLLLGIGWLTRSTMSDETERRSRSAQGIAITFFLAVTSITIAAGAVRESGAIKYAVLADIKRWLTPFAIYYLVVSTAKSTRAVKRMFLAVVVTTAVIGLLGVKQFWMDSGGGGRDQPRRHPHRRHERPLQPGGVLRVLPAIHTRPVAGQRPAAVATGRFCCRSGGASTRSARRSAAGRRWRLWRPRLRYSGRGARLVFLAVAVMAFAAIHTFGLKLPSSVFGRMASTYEANRPGNTVTEKLDTSSRTRLDHLGRRG